MKNLQLIVALLLTGAFSFANSVNAQTTTFNADMGCAPEFYEVFVTGPWCGWCANDGTNQLMDADGDGVYTVAIDGLSGTVEYKYAINGFADQENLINDMVDGGTCAPITDYNGYANRTAEAGTATSDYYGTCDGVCNDNPPVTVTFQVDMADYTGTYGTVNLNGSFNGWCGGCTAMADADGDGVYSVDVVLNAQASVEYKFTLDGWTAQEEFTEGDPCTSTIDGYTNRTLTTGTANEVLNAVCYNSCEACTGEGGGGGGGGTTEMVDVTFQVDMAGYSGTYGQVNVNGSFNSWCGSCAVMTDDDADGVYNVTVALEAGMTYEYKFTVDGWTDQESLVEGSACTSTIDGYTNRTLTTGSASEVLDVVCWNSCEACATEMTMINVTWQVDMSEEGANPAGVFVAGSFQGWSPGASQMTNDGNGVYSYTQEVEAGSFIQWKYLNGADWAFEESVPPSCGNPDDNFNRYMTLGDEDVVLDVVCFGSCVACGTVVETTPVTFNVDMSQQTVSADGVHLAGSVQGWNPATTEMTDADGDGIYSVTLDLEAASYQYKFVNGNAWGFDESVPSECAVSNNREITVGTAAMSVTYCFGQCTAGCVAPLDAAEITFAVDMSQETVAESGVWLMGGFTSPAWQEGAIQMSDDDGDGVYTVTATVDGPAEFQYKFSNGATMVDGAADYSVGEDADFAAAGCGVSNGVGGFNRTYTRNGDVESLAAVCYNSCEACSNEPTALTLTVDVCDAMPTEVRMTGPWWGWDPNGGPVASDNGDGTWSVVLDPIPTDNMEYLWVVDGVQENLIQSMVDGGTCAPITDYANYANRLWEVGSGDASSVYGSCSACETEATGLTLTVDVCDATPSGVRITGPWWGWDPNGGPVASDNGDGTWSVVLDPIPTDNMEYLWVVDGVQENLIQSMVDGGTCAPITDYANYANRLWEVGSGDASSVYGTCGSCDDASGPVIVTVDFAIDMNTTGFPNADYDNIVINGSWNGWGAWGITLADADGDGIFTGSLDLEEGTTFEFVIAATGEADGWSGWGSIFNAPTECEANPGLPIGQGGGNYIHTAMDGSMVQYCAGSCEATCPIPGCTDPFYTEFDMNATSDDGSCATLVVFGCIYEAADNYNSAANTDDGSCEFTLNACPGDLDGDGLVATPDLLQFLSVFGTSCE